MRILLIEDDTVLGAAVRDQIAADGHSVDWVQRLDAAGDAMAGDAMAGASFDLVLLDLMLPDGRGIPFLRRLRAKGDVTPVIILTALDQISDRIEGLNAGADDYLVKPFALQEVEARLAVLARRGKAAQPRVLNVADLEYNLDTLEVRRGGKLLQLNPTALKILQALMEAAPSVVTRQELETRVWGEELPDSDSLRVHIHGLRAAVDKPFDKALVQTRHGIGYRIADPDAG